MGLRCPQNPSFDCVDRGFPVADALLSVVVAAGRVVVDWAKAGTAISAASARTAAGEILSVRRSFIEMAFLMFFTYHPQCKPSAKLVKPAEKSIRREESEGYTD
jgi:hypothetical protein